MHGQSNVPLNAFSRTCIRKMVENAHRHKRLEKIVHRKREKKEKPFFNSVVVGNFCHWLRYHVSQNVTVVLYYVSGVTNSG